MPFPTNQITFLHPYPSNFLPNWVGRVVQVRDTMSRPPRGPRGHGCSRGKDVGAYGGLGWRRVEELGRRSVGGLTGRCRGLGQLLLGSPAVGGWFVCWPNLMPGFFRVPSVPVGAPFGGSPWDGREVLESHDQTAHPACDPAGAAGFFHRPSLGVPIDGRAVVAYAVLGEAARAFLSREERTYTGCPYLLSSETTAWGTGHAKSAGKEDPVELDSSLTL